MKEDIILSEDKIVTITPIYEGDSIYSPFSLNEYIDSIKYIKLDLSDESLIGEIAEIDIHKDHIYIMDIQTSSIFIYTLNGEFVSKIHSIGNGPQEYIQLDYFSIDKNSDQLIATDLTGYWVLRYDLEGNFIKKQKIPFWIDGLYPTEEKGYALFANKRNNKQYFNQEFSLYIVDSLMKVKKQYFPYNSENYGNLQVPAPGNGGFYTANSKSHYYSMYTDTVYKIDTDVLKKKYIFDLGKFAFNTALEKQSKEEFQEYFKKKAYAGVHNVLENDNFIYFQTYFFNDIFGWFGFYDKKSGNILNRITYYLDNNLFFLSCPNTYDDFFITAIPNDVFSDYQLPSGKINSRQEQVKKILENYTEEDNPIIALYKLKNF
ncbi:6-bladed beta-propeller [Parabacteroides sp. AM08-6]|uniref:6-bladed beta-propeller n=1 Tax=Parabacteroides sp. AM08-6 TaxID=2292053 RepID=UPI0013149FA8|nr:6-bladed beta-propeller [Parabacteroides sp. AM08-6]